MGVRFRVLCLDAALTFLLILVRISVLAYTVVILYPDMWTFILKTWNLNTVNWWHSPNEPFITNASFINALFCNTFWFSSMLAILFFLVFVPLLVGIVVFVTIKKRGFGACGVACMSVTCIALEFILKCLFYVIIGSSFDIAFGWDKQDDEFKKTHETTSNFVSREKRGWRQLMFDETRDCPICLVEFSDKDEVI